MRSGRRIVRARELKNVTVAQEGDETLEVAGQIFRAGIQNHPAVQLAQVLEEIFVGILSAC